MATTGLITMHVVNNAIERVEEHIFTEQQVFGARRSRSASPSPLGGRAVRACSSTGGSAHRPGVVVQVGRQSCGGLEVWGSPGVFGSLTDAAACDI